MFTIELYKFACEPAHITDLIEFMPTNSAFIERQERKLLWSAVALNHACFIMLELLQNALKLYFPGKAGIVEALRRRYSEIGAT